MRRFVLALAPFLTGLSAPTLAGCGRIGFDLLAENDAQTRSSGGAAAMDSGGVPGHGGGNGGALAGDATVPTGGSANDATIGVETGGAAGASGGSGGASDAGGGAGSANGGASGGAGGSGAGGGGAGGADATADAGADASSDAGAGCVPTGVETCDGLDNDCNGDTDEGDVCGADCTGATYAGHAYAFCSTPTLFAGAREICNLKSMRLARIDDADENAFAASIAFSAYPAGFNPVRIWPWIGGTSVADPVQWVWEDGDVFWSGRNNGSAVGGLYSNWASASPLDTSGTFCAALSNAATLIWVERSCDTLQPFLCEAY